MNSAAEPVGTLEVALQHASRLLESDPSTAAAQAAEILKVVPAQPVATLVLGVAKRRAGEFATAATVLDDLVRAHPKWALAHFELSLALSAIGQGEAAVFRLRQAVNLKPDMPDAWRALGDHLSAMDDRAGADAAYAQQVKHSTKDPQLLAAAAALSANKIPEAEAMLRQHLQLHPTDVAAIRMLAEVAGRIGRYEDAENLLARCVQLAPSFTAARHNYALVLHRQYKAEAALTEVNKLLATDARNPGYRNLKAAILGRIGEYEQALDIYAGVLAEYPNQAKVWMSYGHALKTAGKQDASIDAYKKSVALTPTLGEAWWSLANLKTFRFTRHDLATMREQLKSADLSNDDRLHFNFAIGKALEDAEVYAESFEQYSAGNALRRTSIVYDADETTQHTQRSKQLFTGEFFAARKNFGSQARDPIFIVGLPRSGSTLLEQILSSHPQVEGTMELPDITAIAKQLTNAIAGQPRRKYPEGLQNLTADECRELGEQYLTRTRIQRKTNAPFFIDKMPNNFAHVGLIQLLLPNAKIIDARRHPLGCCFSAFKQHFARGQHFTYSLNDVGRYYRDYVELMAHFDSVLPGRVHRVIYENMVADTEAETRRLLNYCGLPFDERCLRFFENDRAVRTASSEQVRQPIFRDAVDQWQHFEPWLTPLKEALGPVTDAYPNAPNFEAMSN